MGDNLFYSYFHKVMAGMCGISISILISPRCLPILLLHGSAAIAIVQQSKSTFHKAIIKMHETGLQINAIFGTNVADSQFFPCAKFGEVSPNISQQYFICLLYSLHFYPAVASVFSQKPKYRLCDLLESSSTV